MRLIDFCITQLYLRVIKKKKIHSLCLKRVGSRITLVYGGRGIRKLGLFGSSCHTVGDSRLTRRGTTHSRDISGRGAARAEDAQGTPTQSHISPSILVYEDKHPSTLERKAALADCCPVDTLSGRFPLQERCPPRQKSRVERLKANVEPLLT